MEIFWGDITDKEQVKTALDGVDMVVHMAAIIPPWAYINPDKTFKVNAGGTKNLAEAIKESGSNIPFIYTSSAAAFGPTPDATEPLCPEKTECKPRGAYGESKYQAEQNIKATGIDYLILRLTATMYLSFEFSDFKRMFSIPLSNRIEYCHPYDTAQAIINAVAKYDEVKGNTLIISGGPEQQMIYGDMIKQMLRPPANDRHAMANEFVQQFLDRHQTWFAVDQGQQDDREGVLKRRKLVQLIENHVGIRIPLEVNHKPHGFLQIALVPDS